MSYQSHTKVAFYHNFIIILQIVHKIEISVINIEDIQTLLQHLLELKVYYNFIAQDLWKE